MTSDNMPLMSVVILSYLGHVCLSQIILKKIAGLATCMQMHTGQAPQSVNCEYHYLKSTVVLGSLYYEFAQHM